MGAQELLNGLDILVPDSALHRVGFVGHRGTGKSTLINRLIEYSILPTDPNYPASAALTEVIGWPSSSPRNDIHVCISFIEENEWTLLVEDAIKEIEAWRKDSPPGSCLEDYIEELPKFKVLLESLMAFKEEFSEGAKWLERDGDLYVFEDFLKRNVNETLALLPNSLHELIKRGYLAFQTDLAVNARKLTEPYNVRKCSRWPIVQKISVRGPFKLLQEYQFSIIDIPGEGDSDPLLHKHFETGLLMCDRLYYLPQQKQVAGYTTINDICRLWRGNLGMGFGILITHAAESEEWEDGEMNAPWIPLEMAKETVRNRLQKIVEAPNTIRASMVQSVPIYFVENSPKDMSAKMRYDEHWKDFVRGLTSSIELDQDTLLNNYINNINEAFSIMRFAVKTSEDNCTQLKLQLQGEINYLNSIVSTEFPRESVSLILPNVLSLLASFHWPIPKPHYRTLKSWFSFEDKTLSETILLNLQINPVGVTSLWQLLQAYCTRLKDQLLERYRHLVNFAGIGMAVQRIPFQINENEFSLQLFAALIPALHSQLMPDWKTLLHSGRNMVQKTIDSLKLWYNQNHGYLLEKVCQCTVEFLEKVMDNYMKDIVLQCNRLISALNLRLERKLNIRTAIPNSIMLHDVTSGMLFTADSASTPSQPVDGNSLLQELLDYINKSDMMLCMPDDRVVGRLRSLRIKNRGNVYVMRNPSFKENLFKIGLTTVPPVTRAKKLYSTGVPMPFDVVYTWEVDDVKLMESCMHMIFDSLRINQRREFFGAPYCIIVQVGNIVEKIVRNLSRSELK